MTLVVVACDCRPDRCATQWAAATGPFLRIAVNAATLEPRLIAQSCAALAKGLNEAMADRHAETSATHICHLEIVITKYVAVQDYLSFIILAPGSSQLQSPPTYRFGTPGA